MCVHVFVNGRTAEGCILSDLRVCLQGAKLDSRSPEDTAAAEHASLHLPLAWRRCFAGFSGQQAGAGRYSAGTAVHKHTSTGPVPNQALLLGLHADVWYFHINQFSMF